MDDVNQDVQPESSTVQEQQVVNEPAPDQQVQEQPETDQAQPSPQEVKPESRDDLDDRGVPWKNVAHEALRKVSELESRLPDVLRSVLSETKQTQVEQPKYTKAQLLAFSQDSNITPENKIWALDEIDKIEKTERKREMEEMFNAYSSKTQGELKRQEATRFVADNFPQCFIRDNTGNVVGWNNSDPLVARINQYMQTEPELAKNPSGLVAAAKMAAYDLGIAANKGLQRKMAQTSAQLKKEQKKTLIASGGVNPQQDTGSNAKVAKLVAEYQRTRDPELFKQLAKLRGLIPT